MAFRNFKNCAEQLCVPLTILFNESLKIVYCRRYITPIFKKGNKVKVSYCPVCLTSVIVKVLESIVKDAFTPFSAQHTI